MSNFYDKALEEKSQMVVLNESGYVTGWTFEGYADAAKGYGDDPTDWSTDVNNFVFVSKEYAMWDESWDVDESWPEELPVWEYRPA